jgi:hypothetical protein
VLRRCGIRDHLLGQLDLSFQREGRDTLPPLIDLIDAIRQQPLALG